MHLSNECYVYLIAIYSVNSLENFSLKKGFPAQNALFN